MSKHYSTDAVINCGDDRYRNGRDFTKGLKAILKDAEIDDLFLVSVFGASLELSIKECLPSWIKRIEVMKALGIKRVIFIDHMDCGAFGLQFGKLTKDEERTKHLETLKKARDFFAKYAPEFEFKAYLQNFNEFEEII